MGRAISDRRENVDGRRESLGIEPKNQAGHDAAHPQHEGETPSLVRFLLLDLFEGRVGNWRRRKLGGVNLLRVVEAAAERDGGGDDGKNDDEAHD